MIYKICNFCLKTVRTNTCNYSGMSNAELNDSHLGDKSHWDDIYVVRTHTGDTPQHTYYYYQVICFTAFAI